MTIQQRGDIEFSRLQKRF